ncbi:glycosyltransferase family 4 protein [Halovivax cerinus]|uniref:Glycosyltransferase family 4 protein n=1 Tax=Halovivax cerinus TaxID=1487865 RepID=A0ABD5NP23_9EURY|nr:glycosyltransferase family 4 protein [Halovivax cerinus]
MTTASSEPRVVLLSQYYRPDTSANAGVLTELASGLADRGVDVSVVTTQPSYTADDRASKRPADEVIDGVHVRRLPATRFDRNDGVAKRMLNELTFFLVASAFLFVRQRGDVVLLPTAPSFLPVATVPLRWRGYRPVPIVMDLYPEMAVALGYIDAGGIVHRAWEWANRRAYRRAVVTVTIGERMAERIQERYGPVPVAVIHNWEDGDEIEPIPKAENEFARKHGFDADLTVLYSGNLGRHHELESVVHAARLLEADGVDGVEFVFIGDGGKKERLQALAREHDLDSVSFLPYQPTSVLPQSLTSGDVALVTMDEAVEGLCVPSKFYTALASGQTILAVAPKSAEIARIVDRHDCGVTVEPGESGAIADAVREWLENREDVADTGARSRTVFDERYTKEVAIQSYLALIRRVVHPSPPSPTVKPSESPSR